MTAAPTEATLSHTINISALHDHDVEILVEANEHQRAAIARRLAIPALNLLRGAFTVHPVRGGAEIRLRLDADAERRCVASLEPMTEKIAEEIIMQFDHNYTEADEADEGEEWREPLEGDEIDLGELLVQHLSLALDPYPRRAGAEPLVVAKDTAAIATPFAALKSIKMTDS